MTTKTNEIIQDSKIQYYLDMVNELSDGKALKADGFDKETILKAKYNLYKIESIDFNKEIPKDLATSYNWKKFKRDQYLKSNEIDKYTQSNKEIIEIDRWIEYSREKSKKDYFEYNYDLIKSNLFSFGNNLLIIYMISKYYWKRNKKRNTE